MSDQHNQETTATAVVSSEHELNDLAARVASASRRAGGPINAYHARADIDTRIAQGFTRDELPAIYAHFYGDAWTNPAAVTPALRAEAARYHTDTDYREAMPWSERPC